jgi:hypothetical protein
MCVGFEPKSFYHTDFIFIEVNTDLPLIKGTCYSSKVCTL